MNRVTLVVLECGSDWPSGVREDHADCIALAQAPNEPPSALLRRTYDRLRAIEQENAAVYVAILSCNNDASRKALEGRVPLSRALLTTVLRVGDGRLLLAGRASASDRTRRSLVALAGTLTEALMGTSSSVSAVFGAPPSGVHLTQHLGHRLTA
jgi:hypothetical protein